MNPAFPRSAHPDHVAQRAQLKPAIQIWQHSALPWLPELPRIGGSPEQQGAYFSPTWTPVSTDRGRHFRRTWTPFQAERGRRFSVSVDDRGARE
jgi:hypothetical protein